MTEKQAKSEFMRWDTLEFNEVVPTTYAGRSKSLCVPDDYNTER
jgi:hypothetical protein